ncbi:MAG: hypothetical protein HQL67_08155 [Magnetococcales bacterium]|nr:hypothetical protein [Magnetococcales bacterium]
MMETNDPQIVITACGRQLLRCSTRSVNDFPDCDEAMAARCSPELNALIQLYDGDWHACPDKHTLLFSDTPEDRLAVESIAAWLKKRGQFVELLPLAGLEQGGARALDNAMKTFANWCGRSLANYRLHEFRILFNPAGGSRLLDGILQTLAPFYATESIYLMEDGQELAHLILPGIKAKGGVLLDRHLPSFRRASVGLSLSDGSASSRLFGEDGLTFFGELLWDHNWRELYGERLLEAISPLVRFSEPFRNDAGELERDRLIVLNERMDQLAAHLESQGRLTFPVLAFRPLPEQKRTPPSTHSGRGWTDNKIWQFEGHFEEELFVVDRLAYE